MPALFNDLRGNIHIKDVCISSKISLGADPTPFFLGSQPEHVVSSNDGGFPTTNTLFLYIVDCDLPPVCLILLVQLLERLEPTRDEGSYRLRSFKEEEAFLI